MTKVLFSYTLEGHVPSKKNSKMIVCRGNFPRVLPSKAYTEWHDPQLLLARAQWRGRSPLETAHVAITIHSVNKRTSDLTNKAESVMDLLVDAGVLADDNWNAVPRVTLIYGGVDKKRPRAEVVLTDYSQ